MRRVDLLGVDDVPDGTMQMAWVDGTDQVLVVNTGGTIRATFKGDGTVDVAYDTFTVSGHSELPAVGDNVFTSFSVWFGFRYTSADLGPRSRAMKKMGTRRRFFENLRSITTFLIFPTWDDLLATLAFARPPPTAP